MDLERLRRLATIVADYDDPVGRRVALTTLLGAMEHEAAAALSEIDGLRDALEVRRTLEAGVREVTAMLTRKVEEEIRPVLKRLESTEEILRDLAEMVLKGETCSCPLADGGVPSPRDRFVPMCRVCAATTQAAARAAMVTLGGTR